MASRLLKLTNHQAVCVFLSAQGFSDPRPSGRVDSRHFARVIRRVRLLQIDSVNVLARAHYLPVFSRLGPYRRAALDRWIYEGRHMFEYWCHEQSYAPAGFHPMMRARMERMRDPRWKKVRDLLEHDPGYVMAVLDEVRNRGPIPARHLSDPGEKTGPWWGYGKGKVAMAWLFATGQVAVAHRVNFERWYDRPERVLPAEVLAEPDPSPEEARRARVREAAGALGIGTVPDLADYFRMRITPTARAVRQLVATGELREVAVAGWDRPAYIARSAVVPRARRGTALLCPFDPLVWDRGRTERMFGFRYRIEIYTPSAKRVYGYYVLPFLMNGRLVGRVDAKADRHEGVLRIPAAHAEPGVDRAAAGRALAGELRSMAAWLDLGDIQVATSGNLATATRAAL
ncbi:MAG: winged helix DNA-binding domain-containing protein [bacterium]|nr:winged helix DNA-binding domain-containing protein [bacterium]